MKVQQKPKRSRYNYSAGDDYSSKSRSEATRYALRHESAIQAREVCNVRDVFQ